MKLSPFSGYLSSYPVIKRAQIIPRCECRLLGVNFSQKQVLLLLSQRSFWDFFFKRSLQKLLNSCIWSKLLHSWLLLHSEHLNFCFQIFLKFPQNALFGEISPQLKIRNFILASQFSEDYSAWFVQKKYWMLEYDGSRVSYFRKAWVEERFH